MPRTFKSFIELEDHPAMTQNSPAAGRQKTRPIALRQLAEKYTTAGAAERLACSSALINTAFREDSVTAVHEIAAQALLQLSTREEKQEKILIARVPTYKLATVTQVLEALGLEVGSV